MALLCLDKVFRISALHRLDLKCCMQEPVTNALLQHQHWWNVACCCCNGTNNLLCTAACFEFLGMKFLKKKKKKTNPGCLCLKSAWRLLICCLSQGKLHAYEPHHSWKHWAGKARLQFVLYRSSVPQCKAFCSHHEILPPRPQTSISVFPRELPPGARGQSAASCQPRNVTSPHTHTQAHTHILVDASLLLNTQFTLHQLPRRVHK